MVKGRNAIIRPEIIKNYPRKLMTRGSLKNAGRNGRPFTSRSEENVAIGREMFNRNSTKATFQDFENVVRTWLKEKFPGRWLGRPDLTNSLQEFLT
ncbi:hypothetical protein ANN_22666 [Periplaneta americana]|uniref:Uncharacterized protein n=1 Tax=Periplaneta americana TaxID=6978 RepID=A0ABQ8S8X7_PERAM|nr:hypothetical protein ANN_22666 [Periplaneta americana]